MAKSKKQPSWRFSKENMWTVAGFVLDSFETHQAAFVDVLGADTFGAAFVQQYTAAHLKIKGARGASPRIGGGAQVTVRLYANLDQLKPLLDRLDVRLGLLPAAALTVAPKKFGLSTLRNRLNARDAEAVSRALVVLVALIGENRPALDGKGYKTQELTDLVALQGLIDADNRLQNSGANTSHEDTKVEDADYTTMDHLLSQVLRAGRLLFKADKAKRTQYTATALHARVVAGELPRPLGANPV